MEKGGLATELRTAGITVERGVGWADEMRIGLIGTTRRVWGRRGIKVRQRIQRVYEWRYLNLVVDPASGRFWQFWSRTMTAPMAQALIECTRRETDLAAIVWDRAPSHRDATVRAVGLPLIAQPPYAPELNPAERIFEYLRARIEGLVYPTIEAKVEAVDAVLAALDADPDRVRSLTHWSWIADTLDGLPQEHAA